MNKVWVSIIIYLLLLTPAFMVAQSPEAGDVIINEILFSAKTGGAEFVEIFNRSNKTINLSTMSITKRDLSTLQTGTSVPLNSSGILLPQSYIVLTKNAAAIKSQYYALDTNAFCEMLLPNLLTNEDIVVLQDATGNKLDELHYYSSWHFPLLNDVHGVSLERLSPSRSTNDSTNWHSAAESAGFATPGYRNSQYEDTSNGTSEVTIEPEIFSPDNDGKNDVTNIIFHFATPGYVAIVKVFDVKGRPVRNLVENKLIGNDGAFSWDGVNDKKEKARTGIYVFYIEVWDANGAVKEYKRTCVLTTRL